MADNYLEKKMEEYLQRPATKPRKRSSLVDLLAKNRSHRGFDNKFTVREDQLRSIVEVNRLIPSARNQQVLRFRMVLADESHLVLPHIRLGGALPELHLPFEGQEPRAFVIICSTEAESKYVDMDLGIAAQSMLLRAVEMGLNGICIGAFDKVALREAFALPYEPLLVLAIGRGAERIQIVDIRADEEHTYYRRDDVHFVPKVCLEDLIIK